MHHLGDITKMSPENTPPVDCVTFGSPCQDLSIAGKRAGLAGARSGLFMDAVRVIKDMRQYSFGVYPKFAVWENVPGAFSSNKGDDFLAVLEELARIKEPEVSIPRPEGGKWAKAGFICGNDWSIAWRTFDAQFWGVPQRRRRIALVVDFGGQRAGEILFEPESLRGNSAACGEEGEATPANAERCADVHDNNCLTPWDVQSRHIFPESRVWGTLYAGQGGEHGCVFMKQKPQNCLTPWENQARRIYSADGIFPTLSSREKAGQNGQAVVYSFDSLSSNSMKSKNPYSGCRETNFSKTLDTGIPDPSKNQGGIVIVQATAYAMQGFGDCKESNVSSSLKSRDYKDNTDLIAERDEYRYIVRRLTPTECERLQGFPDGWTDIGDWTDGKGKTRKSTDSVRYKALGNSIALPQWQWLTGKMAQYLPDHATLGSLFDGIGGFPLVWESVHGKGTAIWASEIEEFAIAVTQRRFKNIDRREQNNE